MARVNQEIKAITERMNNNQNSILKAKQALEDIKEDMKWDETELDKWMVRSYHKRRHERLKEVERGRERLGDKQTNKHAHTPSLPLLSLSTTQTSTTHTHMLAFARVQEKAKVVDDDASTLEKYFNADDARIKELTLEIDKLTAQRDKVWRLFLAMHACVCVCVVCLSRWACCAECGTLLIRVTLCSSSAGTVPTGKERPRAPSDGDSSAAHG